MSDCMTFPDTVEEFMEQYKVVDTDGVYMSKGSELVPIFRMKQWFEHLPSAQPEPKWIPVSERPPEEDGEYLVLYYIQSKYKSYVYDVRLFTNDLYKIDEYDFYDKKGQKGWVYYDREYGFCEDNSVIAWMSLPKPYGGI